MNVTGIIAEYNPFHRGHAYHLQAARDLTHADYLLVVMGGNFTQRGEPAILDKYQRTRMALLGGADLVIELPVPFATGSAEFFAEGAVELLQRSGVITSLCFGSENGDINVLKTAAQIILQEPLEYQRALRRALKNGESFPKAREKGLIAMNTAAPEEIHRLLFAPNNILAMEYLKALARRKSSIIPCTIPRRGNYHGQGIPASNEFSSASSLRTLLRRPSLSDSENLLLREQLPSCSYELLVKHRLYVSLEDFASVLHYRLLSASDPLEFAIYLDVSEDLSRRIFSLRHEFSGFDAFIDLMKTRQYTRTRISRALLHILLDVRREDTSLPKYLRILGFRKSAAPLLSAMKEKSSLPLVTKITHRKELQREVYASSLYHLGTPYNEYRQPLVIV